MPGTISFQQQCFLYWTNTPVCSEMEIYCRLPFFCIRIKDMANFLRVFFLYLPVRSPSEDTMGIQYLDQAHEEKWRKLSSKAHP